MELLRALGALSEQPGVDTTALAAAVGLDRPTAAQWHATFVQRYYPYGSVYLGDQGFVGGPVREAVAGVLVAIDATVAPEADHLAVLLDAYAAVDERGWAPARSALLWEHILPWTLPYLDRIAMDGAGPYRAWASLLTTVLMHCADEVPRPTATTELAPETPGPLEDPREGGDLVAGLLAPARYGAIITRDDLLDAADDLSLAPRMGERRYVLRALLDQDPVGTLRWLAEHASSAAGRTCTWPDEVEHLRTWWQQRATGSASLLAELSREAADLTTTGQTT